MTPAPGVIAAKRRGSGSGAPNVAANRSQRRSAPRSGESLAVVEGERVLGRFTVGEKIGGGGHGTVHRAWDERLCRWVAVKSIEGAAAERVMREAHAAARLNHPGIVTLYELGSQNGCAYLVSELVEGPNLREMAGRGELSDREVAELGAELCAALTHAHEAGVVHRDIKPDNVLVRTVRSRSVKGRTSQRALLADFGIATLEDGPTLTATGQVVGTLQYMSPEQATGDAAGAPSDVYSLGLTLYELWAGFNPVAKISPAATARSIGEPVESLGEARPELPLLALRRDRRLPRARTRGSPRALRSPRSPARDPRRAASRSRGAASGRGARRRHAPPGTSRAPLRDPARRRRGRPARGAGRPSRPRDRRSPPCSLPPHSCSTVPVTGAYRCSLPCSA